MVGRSTGKRFLNAGVSLPQDPEVSTTHGKVRTRGSQSTVVTTGLMNRTLATAGPQVDFKDGSVGFTDVGSTNGTSINGFAPQPPSASLLPPMHVVATRVAHALLTRLRALSGRLWRRWSASRSSPGT